MLVDSHCHLDFPDFEGELDDVMARAKDAGIGHMMTICTRVTKFDGVLALAEAYDNVFCTVGIHPHNTEDEPETTAQELIGLSKHPKVVGLGETGLDFFYFNSPRDIQEKSFRAHITAARETGLPLVIHNRDSDEDMIRVLRDEHARGPFPGVIHCFSSGPELAENVMEIGLSISFSGIVTFKTADVLRDVARQVPIERILVETDSPYLAPVPKRGKRNEPAFTAFTAAEVAGLKGMDADAFAKATTDNYFRLFSKAASEVGT
ncbi:MAG: TatD family hydrolase [Proteobacteria bacterium]|nr:TatD family hydrolase [Pseudomonadota bacterium]MDA1023601.1 TatD family hydrolase [Pseudomonadota bacterium]